MLLDYIQLAAIWYYFNILVVVGIIYFVMKIAVLRAKKAVVNGAESETKEDRMFIRFAMFTAIFGVIYFLSREYHDEIIRAWELITETAGEIKNG